MNLNYTRFLSLIAVITILSPGCSDSVRISHSVTVSPGAVNGVTVEKLGRKLVIYGNPGNDVRRADMVLFTHYRRDVIWAGRDLVKRGAYAIAPAEEKQFFAGSDSLWRVFDKSRFHDYYCQSTKIGFTPLKADRYVSGGENVNWHGVDFKVLSTPGFTRGAVSYLAEIDGKKFAFTGDLIYGEGKIPDLYSFQDSWEEIRGYHGYAARVGKLLSSLRQIAAEKPDFIIPSRGPVIMDPQAAIQKLIQSIERLYMNYLSVSAYRWYYPAQVTAIADSFLGPSAKIDWMPYASVILKNPPGWYYHFSNSNLVFADDSSAFLIDCGVREAFDEVMAMKHSGRIKKLDGIFITHYHDDHTDLINDVVRVFGCPVYVTKELKDILENPSAYHLPCLTNHPIPNLTIMQSGQSLEWKDFTLTFNYFPGQTLYHDAVLFQKKNGGAIFFIGDSFTPSGIDDYCLLNRNFLHPGTGYFLCLDMLRTLPDNTLLANQHVEPLFSFSREQLDHMTSVLQERAGILKELFTFDDINYGIDEQWAHIYPYGQKAAPGGSMEFAVRIFNHSDTEKTFTLKPDRTEGFGIEPVKASMVIKPHSEGGQTFKVNISKKVEAGISLLTVDIKSGGMNLHEWAEGLVEISN
jgi:glyoxylase-like metal-dependent hydrolase (beta-lactamase superfamily II)